MYETKKKLFLLEKKSFDMLCQKEIKRGEREREREREREGEKKYVTTNRGSAEDSRNVFELHF